MAVKLAYDVPRANPETLVNIKALLRILILAAIAGAAVASRLFAVIRFESIIHEFGESYLYRCCDAETDLACLSQIRKFAWRGLVAVSSRSIDF